ncbi:M protein repeat protein, partial [Oesophagostomum dentatum]
LLDMSLSMPDDIERLEKQVAETEEKERRLASAVVYVDQCKKIMEEKVRNVRKQISACRKEEASLTTKVEELRTTMEEALSTHKQLLEIKSDVSLMDSLFTSVQTLNSELTELQESLKRLPHTRSLADMKKDLNEKEDSVVALNTELEEIQLAVTERNKLTTEMQALKERRISLGELAAQSSHLHETLSRHREEYEKLTARRDEITKKELPQAKNALNEAKFARDTAERYAKEQEEIKTSAIRAICNHYSAYSTLKERLSKASKAAEEGQIDSLKLLISERDQSIIDLEKRKAGFELGVNDLESTHVKRRTLEDQLTRMLIESKIAGTEKELNDLVWSAEEKEALCQKRAEATRDRDRSSLEKARLNGQLEEVEKK